MSLTQTAVYAPSTKTSTTEYRTLANEAEYRNWSAEFSALNSVGQTCVDFRVRHFHHLACSIILYTSNIYCRRTNRPNPCNSNALQILKGASTLILVALIYTSSTSSIAKGHAAMSPISPSSPTCTVLLKMNLSPSNPWAV
jgi:hypothetical protein